MRFNVSQRFINSFDLSLDLRLRLVRYGVSVHDALGLLHKHVQLNVVVGALGPVGSQREKINPAIVMEDFKEE